MQVFVGAVYFYAGLAKCGSDWTSGSTPRILLKNSGLRGLLSTQHGEALLVPAMMYGGLSLDLLAGFALVSPSALVRNVFTAAVVGFHLTNHFAFTIETFPWVMLSSCAVYHSAGWMQALSFGLRRLLDTPLVSPSLTLRRLVESGTLTVHTAWSRGLKPLLVLGFLGFHLLAPLSCGLASVGDPGVVSWGTSCHYFNWQMMARSAKTATARLKFTNPETNASQVLALHELGFNLCSSQQGTERGGGGSSICIDAASFIEDASQYESRLWAVVQDTVRRVATDQKLAAPRVYADVWLEVNGPPIQRFVDPTVDIAALDTFRVAGTQVCAEESTSGSVSSVLHHLSARLLSQSPVAPAMHPAWVMPRLTALRTPQWQHRFLASEKEERASAKKSLDKKLKKTPDKSVQIQKLMDSFEVLFVAEGVVVGHNHIKNSPAVRFNLERPSKLLLLQGRALVSSATSSHKPVSVSPGTPIVTQGAVLWSCVGRLEVAAAEESPSPEEKEKKDEECVWMVVLDGGQKTFTIESLL
jgi:hypothetical protein